MFEEGMLIRFMEKKRHDIAHPGIERGEEDNE